MVLHSQDRLPVLPKLPSATASFKWTNTGQNGSINSLGPPTSPKGLTVWPESGHINTNDHENLVRKIIPVDPMAWGWDRDERGGYKKSGGMDSTVQSPVSPTRSGPKTVTWSDSANQTETGKGRGGWEEHDVLLSVSECGELAFWIPQAYVNSNGVEGTNGRANGKTGHNLGGSDWRCTGRVRTERKGFNRARCSSAKKTALGIPIYLRLWCSFFAHESVSCTFSRR